MELHRAVFWLLRVEQAQKCIQLCGDIAVTAFQRQWAAGPTAGLDVVIVRLSTTALIEDIELWLRGRVEAELRKTWGADWWQQIPCAVRERTVYRHKLACAEFGMKRAGRAHSANWLSFGDAIKVLALLPVDLWIRCLETTSRRQGALDNALRRVKAFRDNRIAHCQSGGPTPTEAARALRCIAAVCGLLRPEDCERALAALKVLTTLDEKAYRVLCYACEPRHKPRPNRRTRLAAVAQVLAASMDSVRAEAEAPYYDALLELCCEACGTISGPLRRY